MDQFRDFNYFPNKTGMNELGTSGPRLQHALVLALASPQPSQFLSPELVYSSMPRKRGRVLKLAKSVGRQGGEEGKQG